MPSGRFLMTTIFYSMKNVANLSMSNKQKQST